MSSWSLDVLLLRMSTTAMLSDLKHMHLHFHWCPQSAAAMTIGNSSFAAIWTVTESLVPLETGNHLDSVAGVLFPVDQVPMQQGLLMQFWVRT